MKLIALLLIIFILAFSACDSTNITSKWEGKKLRLGTTYELTETDIFSEGAKGNQVTVFGVGLGDSKEYTINKLGQPDNTVEFYDIDTENLEYGESFGMEKIGLSFQLHQGTVERITIKQPFNKYLHGKTMIDHEKEEIYFDVLGVPDSQMDHLYRMRIFYYEDEGYEVFLKKDMMNGFSIVEPKPIESPKRKLDSNI